MSIQIQTMGIELEPYWWEGSLSRVKNAMWTNILKVAVFATLWMFVIGCNQAEMNTVGNYSDLFRVVKSSAFGFFSLN